MDSGLGGDATNPESAPESPAAAGPGDDLDWVASGEPAGGPKWRSARIGAPSLVVLLVLIGVAGLGFASIGGYAGFALIVLLVVAILGLLYTWSNVPPDPQGAPPASDA